MFCTLLFLTSLFINCSPLEEQEKPEKNSDCHSFKLTLFEDENSPIC